MKATISVSMKTTYVSHCAIYSAALLISIYPDFLVSEALVILCQHLHAVAVAVPFIIVRVQSILTTGHLRVLVSPCFFWSPSSGVSSATTTVPSSSRAAGRKTSRFILQSSMLLVRCPQRAAWQPERLYSFNLASPIH